MNTKKRYQTTVIPNLKTKLKKNNLMSLPKLTKIVLNRGMGSATENPSLIELTVNQFIALTGQKPVLRKAKKSISNFKLRENQIIGCKVTLRRDKMYHFFDKFINLASAKIRDFRGFKPSFDSEGNLTIGIRECESIFPELTSTTVDNTHGLSITIVTSTKDKLESRILFDELGFPFKKN